MFYQDGGTKKCKVRVQGLCASNESKIFTKKSYQTKKWQREEHQFSQE